ncbi:MAG: hypothetical protein ACREBR_01200, partial [bacterium]
GLSIEMAARQGSRNQYRVSKYTWPNQQQPSRAAWLEWKKALLRISHSDGRLHQSLGRWKDTRRRSQEFKICLSRDKQTLFCKEGKIWTQHNHAGGLRRPTYQRQGAICISAPPDALPASAKKETRVWGQVNCRDIQPAVTEKVHLLLREQFKSLPPVLKRLLGKYKIPADQGKNILLTIRRSTAIAVSDGSVKDGKGSHAWCVQGKNPSLGIEGVGPTDGDPERMSSFRAELHGVAAVLTAMVHLIKFNRVNEVLMGRLDVFCDNEAVVKFGTSAPSIWSISAANAPEYDISSTIRKLLKQLPIHVNFVWVKGHQNVFPLTREASLNNLMDEKAKEFLVRIPAELSPRKSPLHFPQAKITFNSLGLRNTTHLREQIYKHRTTTTNT